ncbi:MAG: ComF family protein [Gammaproteobacteria bacterium]
MLALRPVSVLRLPTRCAVCRQWAQSRVCAPCVERFAASRPRCRTCAIAVPAGTTRCGDCLREAPPFTAAVAAVDYAYPWADVVASFKFAQGIDRVGALADLLAAAILRDDDAANVDLVVPVPLAGQRLAERGYNQAWELARRVARRLRRPARADLLQRWVDTPHVADLPRARRPAAVRGAFGVAPADATPLRGRRVALVDDVMTTGATATEATRALLAAGAAEVLLWVLARTPRPADA